MINKVVSRLLYSFINISFIYPSLTSFLPSLLFPCCILISPIPQPQQYNQYSNYTTCCMILVLKTGTVNRFYSSPKTSTPAVWPPTFLFHRFHGSFLQLNSQDTKLTAQLYLVSRLRMSGAVPLLPLFTFMMRTVVTFNSRFLLFSIHPSIPIPSICPTNRPVQLPFCSPLHQNSSGKHPQRLL